MFYEQSQIEEILACKQCHIRYDTPRLLACGECICDSCAAPLKRQFSAEQDLLEYKCPVCGEMHDTPKHLELPASNAILTLLKQQPRELPRSPLIQEFDRRLGEVRRKLMEFESDVANSNGRDKVVEFCQALRIDIQLATERRVEQLHEASDELLAQVNLYEKECARNLDRIRIVTPDKCLNKVCLFFCSVEFFQVFAKKLSVFSLNSAFIIINKDKGL